jgi:SAM-dependent methyltransferase
MAQDDQAQLNANFWARGECVEFYAKDGLRPVEKLLLERFAAQLAGTVLELGCGAGRLTGHLCELARELHALDLSPAMVAYCRSAYPRATFTVGDLRDLSGFTSSSYDAVVAPFNVLDVLGDAERREVLHDIGRLLAPEGLLIISSHNREYVPRRRPGFHVWIASPRHPLASLRRLPRRLRNRHRMRALELSENDYAIRNDEAHEFAVLHYYISRDAQESQLAAQGFQLIECLDLDGQTVTPGSAAAECPELHYVARRE